MKIEWLEDGTGRVLTDDGDPVTLWHVHALTAFAEATHIGHRCTATDCIEIARWRCYWPGATTLKCDAHRRHLERVARALGFDLPVAPVAVAQRFPDPSAERFAAMELE